MKWNTGRLFFGFAQVVFLVLYRLELIPAFLIPAPFLIGFVWAAWSSANVCSQVFVPVTCRISSEKGILITFDDGPHPEYTPHILAILKKHDVRALFFLIGEKAGQHPELVKVIRENGHLLGNHSHGHHFFFSLRNAEALLRDIQLCHQTLTEITGETVRLFRPPFGVTNPPLAKALKNFPQYRVIGWSVRSYDTVTRNANTLMSRLVPRIQNGDIVLLHDRCAVTAASLDKLLEALKDKGLKFADPNVLLDGEI